jgi:hypothetical protein
VHFNPFLHIRGIGVVEAWLSMGSGGGGGSPPAASDSPSVGGTVCDTPNAGSPSRGGTDAPLGVLEALITIGVVCAACDQKMQHMRQNVPGNSCWKNYQFIRGQTLEAMLQRLLSSTQRAGTRAFAAPTRVHKFKGNVLCLLALYV